MKSHADKVDAISLCIKKAFQEKKRLRIFHGTSTTTREISFEEGAVVDTSDLNAILEIHEGERYAIVEPSVSIGELAFRALRYGLIPPVVMEFPAITIGGAIQGGAGESSSFKFGGLHTCCEEYEAVLGNGDIVTASRSENSDLFWGMACSYGSIAVITKVKIRLIPAKSFVKLSYIPTRNTRDALQVMKQESAHNPDFLDAIVFDKDNSVVMVGMMTDAKPTGEQIVTFSRREDEWFYLHALEKAKARSATADIMPLTDYLFRYNLGVFWMGKFLFNYLKIPFWKSTRRFFNKWLNAKNSARAIHAINKSQSFLVQDCCVPEESAPAFLDYLHETLSVYPLWLCPLLPSSEPDFLAPNTMQTAIVLNVGIYTKLQGGYEKSVEVNRNLEKFLAGQGGRKVLYAHQYYSEDEFWNIYDKKRYEDLRIKYHAKEVFLDIYEKTHVNRRYSVSLLKGILQILKSPRKLILDKTRNIK